MTMLDHIQTFAMLVTQDGWDGGDITISLPPKSWLATLAAVSQHRWYSDRPLSLTGPITLATSYGFNVIVKPA